jgi:hypothetical protein
VVILSVVMIGVGTYLGLRPAPAVYAGILAGVAGALLLTLGLRGLDIAASRNRTRIDGHLRQIREQVRVLSGDIGSRQGIWMGDWGNARRRDLGPTGSTSSYARLPLLVRLDDLRWPVRNATNTNTGVPIDEIDGMELTREHLGTGRNSLTETELDAREILSAWRQFDIAFEERLLARARAKLSFPPLRLEAGWEGWEDVPWFAPVPDTWRLGASAFVVLTMGNVQTTDGPRFHDPGPGDLAWDVRLGDSGLWLLRGSPPAPTDTLASEVLGIVTDLRMDAALRQAYMAAVDKEAGVRDRIRSLRATLATFDGSECECALCSAVTVLAPSKV